MRSFVLLLLLAGSAFSMAQAQPAKRIRAEMITVDDGLPQGLIWSVVQDQQGFLWIGTKDGLVRYDGYEFRVFRNVPNDTTSLAGNHITALLEDDKGFLWVGTERNGLHRYDPRNGRFSRIKRGSVGAPIAGIVCIEEDGHGDLWVHEYGGDLLVVRNAVGSTMPLPTMDRAVDRYPGLQVQQLCDILTTPNGDLWVLEREELSVWSKADGGYTKHYSWPVPWPWTELEYNAGLLDHHAAGRVLLVWEYNAVAFDADTYTVMDTLQLPALQLRGRNLVIDEADRLWGYGPSGTWFRMDLRTGNVEFLKPELEGGRSIPGKGFLSWTMDRNGNVWMGTSGYGLVKYRASTERFHTHRYTDTDLSYSAIVDPDGRGTELLVHEELRTLNTTVGTLDSTAVIKALAAQGLSPTWGVCTRDPMGCYWMGGFSRTPYSPLYRFDPRNGKLDRISTDPLLNVAAAYPGTGSSVWALLIDLDDKDRNALCRVDTRSSTMVERFEFPGPIRSGTYREIACWRIAADSTIWMATGNGVYGLQTSTGTWIHYLHDDQDSTSIPGNEVFSLCFDPDEPERFMWVGTEGKGMARMDLRTGRCEPTITTAQGLPNNVIYGILPDAHHNLWISTNQGLCRFDPRTGAKKTYTNSDGIAGNEFNRYSAERSADGILYFGGMEGITWFDPEDFYQEANASPTRITGLKLLNTPVTVADNASFLPVPITGLEELTLPYSERMITFAFANMDHSVPGQNEYRYILEGLNTNWIENGTGHEATFTNLDPGTYTFKVQGRNSEGVWDGTGASLLLTITPPWWGTWWFRLAALLAIAGIIVAFFRYRLARAMEVVSVRDQIARDLHDEIGSTLSSVALYSTVARSKAGDRVPEASEMLGRITESTTAVMEAMNDIVWAVNAENDDMEHLVQRMRSYAVQMTDAGECALHFQVQDGLSKQVVGMSQRKNLYLLFKEAVNNAMKYADCANLQVSLDRDGVDVVLSVEDDGKGFEPNTKNNGSTGGNGLGNMQKRTAEMNGTLSISSSPGVGTTVTLRFRNNPAKSLDPMIADRNTPR